MKKLLSYVIAILLSLSMAFVFVACDDGADDDESIVTGNFEYEIVTEERDSSVAEKDKDGNDKLDDFGNVVYEKEDYKFYKITGFTVSSDDATKMADGDFSTVTKYRSITIPADYTELNGATEDLPVEEIAMSAFANQIIFTEIKVGNNIKKIGEGAFAGCSNLQTLELPFIGASADAVNEARLFGYVFGDAVADGSATCTGKLHQRVDASNSVISSEEDITYYIPESLTKVILNNVTEIGECAFYGMTTLKEIIIPSTVNYIANHAFYGCTALMKIDIPAAVTEIGNYAFSGDTSLYAVNYNENSVLETIGNNAFDGCSVLNSSYVNDTVVLKLPSTVKYIGKNAFNACTTIKSVDLSNLAQLNTIETGTFAGCTALNKVKFAASTTITVKNGAFNGCTNLVKTGVDKNGATITCQVGAFDFDLND